jgi:hypothetical protein
MDLVRAIRSWRSPELPAPDAKEFSEAFEKELTRTSNLPFLLGVTALAACALLFSPGDGGVSAGAQLAAMGLWTAVWAPRFWVGVGSLA